MKIFLKALALILLSKSFFAQNQPGCGFNKAYEKLFEFDGNARVNFEKAISQKTENVSIPFNKTQSPASYTIPIVFHILHLNGSENISDAQVFDAVSILNRDYRKLNQDTANIVSQFQSVAADCSIQFSLATKDNNGKCTNGITRHYDSNTNWTIDFANYLYTWPPSKYLNVYVVNSMPSGVAGYAYLPGTVGATADAIVILNDYVGSIGTSNPYTSRALTHEVGHWLNLQHTWGSTNNPGVACGDDGVGDTPITKGHNFCNLSNGIDCTPGVVENIQNYMEYAYCSNMFTQGQRNRMHNCLNSTTGGRNNLSTNANLIATGVINPLTACPPTPEFQNIKYTTCVGNSVAFSDLSYNGPTSWLWSSNQASNTSTLQNGVLTFTAPGLASVKLKVSNANGSDSIIYQNVMVLSGSGTGISNVVEGFEAGVFPVNNWQASTPQYGSGFKINNSASATGTSCVWVNNFFDNPNEPVNLYSPAFDLSNSTSAQLEFKYAYSQQNSSNADKLRVLVSTNCGGLWTSIFSKTGSQLSSTGVLMTQAFTAPANPEWSLQSLSLNSFSGASKLYVRFEFTSDPNGAGNNFFLDDINVANIVSVKEENGNFRGISVYPNPFNSKLVLKNEGEVVTTSYSLLDISSRVIASGSLSVQGKEVIINYPADLTPGVYFLQINSDKGAKIFKVIKQ